MICYLQSSCLNITLLFHLNNSNALSTMMRARRIFNDERLFFACYALTHLPVFIRFLYRYRNSRQISLGNWTAGCRIAPSCLSDS